MCEFLVHNVREALTHCIECLSKNGGVQKVPQTIVASKMFRMKCVRGGSVAVFMGKWKKVNVDRSQL